MKYIDELWRGGPRFIDREGVFRVCTDSVLLAYFAGKTRIKTPRAVDLGCGAGVISILLAYENPEMRIDGIEIQPDAARLAAENADINGLSSRIAIHNSDLRRHRGFLEAGLYDLAVTNPPYYICGSGKRSGDAGKAAARGEELCTLEDICTAAGYLVRWGGSFMLVHKPERFAGIFRALNNTGFEPKRIRFVQHKSQSPPSLVLIESRRGGKASLKTEAPLILANDDGSDSDEVKKIYRRGLHATEEHIHD